ncbi:hypothetical protein RHSIM_Rhsim01G0181900 [Rhododendron simsii]|uniref:Uncharacterized protein n=1 Tax=Rhododendron simsii TaxID=118357 RepID=A0A834HH98_RHOSS|nr:hypothetical protein RHSIM_Rhsim01G0181900 [Rhododendron simsii]
MEVPVLFSISLMMGGKLTLFDYCWDNIGSFDDLDRIFRYLYLADKVDIEDLTAEQRYLYASNEQFCKILKSTLQLNLNVTVSLAEV